MLEHEGLRLLVAGRLQPLLDAFLRLRVHVQRDVVERRERHLRPELLLVLRVGELEERERAAVAEPEEAVAVGALGAEQHVLLAPGREQRQPDDVLVELARRLEILRDVRVVVQPVR